MKQVKQVTLLFPIGKVAEIELMYRTQVSPMDRPRVGSSHDANDILRPYFEQAGIEHREHMFVLYLNRANRVVGCYHISSGGVAGTVADPKVILQGALLCNASGFIMAHNHPSGNTVASQADITLTKKVKEAAIFMEMQLLDHMIMTQDRFLSMADEGLM